MQHEVLAVLAGQRVNLLRIAVGAQRGSHQRLGFAAGEQRRAVHAWQHAVADFDLAHGARVATVNAWLARQDLAAHDLRLDVEQHVVDLDLVDRSARGRQGCQGVGGDFASGLGACLLRADLIGRAQRLFGQGADLRDEGLVLGWRLPVPGRLAGITNQFVDGSDGHLALLMAEHHAAEHDFFAQLLGFGLDHQHGGIGARHHQIHLRIEQLRLAWVQHVLAVDVAHARRADGAIERDARDGHGRTRSDQRRDVSRHLRVERQHMNHDLDLVVEAFGKQRTQRPVDQARGQGLEFAGAAFALEEAARDLAGSVGLLDVVDRQREEVLARLGILRAHHGGQHHGVFDVDDHRAAGLAGDLAGFQHHGVLTPLERLGYLVEHAHRFLRLISAPCGWRLRPESPDNLARCHSSDVPFETTLE